MGLFDFISSLWRSNRAERVRPETARPPASSTPLKTPPIEAQPVGLWDTAPNSKADVSGQRAGAGDDLDAGEDLDAALSAFFAPGEQSGDSAAQPLNDQDQAATLELFSSIASNYSRPIKNFIFELKRGTATKEWLEICRPVLSSIVDAAESMELASVARCMADFDESLSMAQNEDGHELTGETRDLILSIYEELVETLPATFELGELDQRREGIIIHSLLRQIPDVGYVTIEKLYRAGLTSLDMLLLANKKDMSATTAVPERLCDRICVKMREHRDRLDGQSPESLLADHRARLIERLTELRQHHEAFKRACEADHADPKTAAAKRESRCARQACALQINVVLAEMGELDLVEEIQKLAFERRIEKLEAYIEQSSSIIPTALGSESSQPPIQTPA